MNLNTIKDHLLSYAEKHTDLLHSDSNVAFVRLWSKKELQSIRANSAKNIVVVTSFSGKDMGDYEEQRMQQFLSLRFASYAPNEAGIIEALYVSFGIMMDF